MTEKLHVTHIKVLAMVYKANKQNRNRNVIWDEGEFKTTIFNETGIFSMCVWERDYKNRHINTHKTHEHTKHHYIEIHTATTTRNERKWNTQLS